MIDSLLNGGSGGGDENMSVLSELETDAIGESVNISMGSGAKALSTMLNLKVLITTPKVEVQKASEFQYISMFPAMGVTIKYVEGLSGFNFFVMKRSDIKRIANIMMGLPVDDGGTELSEIDISAISEAMNQMMGASSTSLATFFNRKINISTPDCSLLNENDDAKNVLGISGNIVIVKLKLIIGDIIDSEFINIMPLEFAKELAENLINVQLPAHVNSKSDKKSAREEETDRIIDSTVKEIKQKAAPPPPPPSAPPAPPRQQTAPAPMQQTYKKVEFDDFDSPATNDGPMRSNLDLIMDVPLDVVVQIGKTRKLIKDIVALTQGSIIELEKQAGSSVDVVVNGEMIARGDVVVIDDNFGVRITEILSKI